MVGEGYTTCLTVHHETPALEMVKKIKAVTEIMCKPVWFWVKAPHQK